MKTIIRITLLICFVLQTQAQNEDQQDQLTNSDWQFAAKAGLNYSKVNGDIGTNESGLLDFNIGAVINVPTGLKFNVQIEPQISRVGARRDGKTLRRYTFLDVPILLQVFNENDISIEAGPKIALTLDQRQESEDGELVKVDRLKAINLGLAAGATYNFDSNWFGQFRINYWFSDIIKKDVGDTEGTSILLFQLSVGYWFN